MAFKGDEERREERQLDGIGSGKRRHRAHWGAAWNWQVGKEREKWAGPATDSGLGCWVSGERTKGDAQGQGTAKAAKAQGGFKFSVKPLLVLEGS